MLHELDKELEKEAIVSVAMQMIVTSTSKARGQASGVIDSIGKFIEEELQLKVNQSKSAVDSPTRRKFLGFSFYYSRDGVKVKLHAKTLARIKSKVKTYTKRSNGKSIEERITDLDLLIKGWVNYYKITDMRKHCQRLDEWMRRRLRMCIWKQWKKIGSRLKNLVKLGINYFKAWEYANTRKGYWHTSNSPILAC